VSLNDSDPKQDFNQHSQYTGGTEGCFNPKCLQNQKTVAGSIKKQCRALGFGIICGMLSMHYPPKASDICFFDVRLVCGQGHLGIEKGFWVLLAGKPEPPFSGESMNTFKTINKR